MKKPSRPPVTIDDGKKIVLPSADGIVQISEIRASAIRLPAPAAGAVSVGGAVAKRGRRTKSGARYGCGKLREPIDIGHDLTLAHRAAIVGAANARDYRAGFPLGVLRLRNEIDQAQFQAGEAFAALRSTAGPRGGHEYAPDEETWGGDWRALMPARMTQSQLANLIDNGAAPLSDLSDDDRKNYIRWCSRRLRTATGYLLMESKLGLEVLERVLDHLVAPECYLSRKEHEALTRVLDRLVSLFKIPRAGCQERTDADRPRSRRTLDAVT